MLELNEDETKHDDRDVVTHGGMWTPSKFSACPDFQLFMLAISFTSVEPL